MVTRDQTDLARLRKAAARRGVSLEEAAADVMRLGLQSERRVAAGLAVLDRLDREQEPIGEEEAMRTPIEEVRAMRAERRGGDGDQVKLPSLDHPNSPGERRAPARG